MTTITWKNTFIAYPKILYCYCVLFLTTASSSGFATFLELQHPCEVFIDEESATSISMDNLVSLPNTHVNYGSQRRLHFCICAQNQLPKMSHVPFMMSETNIGFKNIVQAFDNPCSRSLLQTSGALSPSFSQSGVCIPRYQRRSMFHSTVWYETALYGQQISRAGKTHVQIWIDGVSNP